MPDNTTAEREQLLRLYGAEIVHSPGAEGSNGAIRLAAALAEADPALFMPYQYGNEANPRAHERGTGPEILAQVPDVDVFVAGLGTGGTLTGVGRHLKAARPGVRVVAAEPLPGRAGPGPPLPRRGLRPAGPRRIGPRRPLARDDRDALVGVRRLLGEEGIFAGLSSGAAITVALRVAAEMDSGSVVVLLADGGWKYLSVDLWTPRPRRARRRAGGVAAVVAERLRSCRGASPMSCSRTHARRSQRGLRAPLRHPGASVEASAYHPARNAEASPYVYSVHPDDLVRIVFGIEDAGEDLVAIFHSHTHTPAVPSPTDVREAHYPDAWYLLASLAKPHARPEAALRAWRIIDGESREGTLRIV